MLLDAGYSDSPKGSLQTAVLPGVRLDQMLDETHDTCYSGSPLCPVISSHCHALLKK